MATSAVEQNVGLPDNSGQKQFKGVQPIRAGQGHSFFWRRLHSLTGIIPVGAFLFEHILISNATAMNGPEAYANQVRFLGSLPMVLALEALGIWLPLLYHSLYGFYIWFRAEPNLGDYKYAGNWFYSVQRWTGAIAFFYIGWHIWHLRFAGVDLHHTPEAAFGKVQQELAVAWQLAFYIVGLLAASWHFAYGIWLFCAKWGITVGEKSHKKLLIVCTAFFLLMAGVGLGSITKFKTTEQQPADKSAESLRTAPAPATSPVDKR